jgi:hypothetical protein
MAGRQEATDTGFTRQRELRPNLWARFVVKWISTPPPLGVAGAAAAVRLVVGSVIAPDWRDQANVLNDWDGDLNKSPAHSMTTESNPPGRIVGIPDKWLSAKPRGVPRRRNRCYFTSGPTNTGELTENET